MRLPAELVVMAFALAGCAGAAGPRGAAPDVPLQRTPVSNETTKVGATYTAGGRRYTPRDERDYEETGIASWYGEELRGSRTASGELYDPNGYSGAHRTLPLPSYVEVTSFETGRTILVRINDRGPFHSSRIVDLSLGAARQLGITGRGAHQVRLRRVEPSEKEKLALRRGEPVALRRAADADELARMRARVDWQAPPGTSVAVRPPSGEGPFYLQVASFSCEARARALAATLSANVSVIAGTWRVRLGPYKTAGQAIAALAPLTARGYPDAIVTR